MSYLNQANRLLFVHIYKNAGSSIVQALRSAFVNDLDYIPPRFTGLVRIDRRLDRRIVRGNGFFAVNAKPGIEKLRCLEEMRRGHLSLKTFEENILIADLESFAVIRNPWSWQVSLFNFVRNDKSHFQHGQPHYASFDNYIRWRCEHEVRLQSHFLESHKGIIGIKHLLRFETLHNDWSQLSKKTGWRLPNLPHTNKSTFDDWRHYYSAETADLVGRTFSKDCSQFGYYFNS